MRAQIFNERAGQGIDQFMTMAESSELSEIDALIKASGFPEETAAFSRLSPTQKNQYYWYLRADRFRVETLLYQQLLEVLENDPGPVGAGRRIVREYEAMYKARFFDEAPRIDRLRRPISEVDEKHEQDN